VAGRAAPWPAAVCGYTGGGEGPVGGALVRVDEKRCKGCGICVGLCPRRVFVPDERGKVRVGRPEECVACGLCDSLCPDLAITVEPRGKGRKEAPAGAAAV